jgi:hypothetical protein
VTLIALLPSTVSVPVTDKFKESVVVLVARFTVTVAPFVTLMSPLTENAIPEC